MITYPLLLLRVRLLVSFKRAFLDKFFSTYRTFKRLFTRVGSDVTRQRPTAREFLQARGEGAMLYFAITFTVICDFIINIQKLSLMERFKERSQKDRNLTFSFAVSSFSYMIQTAVKMV
jgi:hypothetical protein